MLRVAAVDLGATSARVAVIDLDAATPTLNVVHRYGHRPIVYGDGTLRWNWSALMGEIELGLEVALAGGPLASIGVDAWGVDYGLLDANDQLIAPPFCYRDGRTHAWRDVVDILGEERLYATTGVQLMAINTIFQLAVHDQRELARAATLLMIPELVVHGLTGTIASEVTSATTSALVDLNTGDWSDDLLDAIGVPRSLMPRIAHATSRVGYWRGVPVQLVGGHDTASAVAARPPGAPAASAFISTGTWFVVGAERRATDASQAARAANFSNEAGAMGGTRFLKNVTGLWLLEQCRAAWGDPPNRELTAAADASGPGGPLVDPNDARFVNPADMASEIVAAAGLAADADRGRLVRCILDSIAAKTAAVVGELNQFLGSPVTRLDVLGGGAQNALLCRLLAEATGVDVVVGAAEATALGNALVQGIALGRFADLDSARASIPRVT